MRWVDGIWGNTDVVNWRGFSVTKHFTPYKQKNKHNESVGLSSTAWPFDVQSRRARDKKREHVVADPTKVMPLLKKLNPQKKGILRMHTFSFSKNFEVRLGLPGGWGD